MFLHFRSRKALLFLVLTTLATASGLAATPIVPISAVSRKEHGGVPFDLLLPLTGAAGLECREDSGEHEMVIGFATTVTVNTVTVSSGAGEVLDWWVDGSTVHVLLKAVLDGQRLTVTLGMVEDGINVNDVIVPMSVLAGDTTANGNVDGYDVANVQSLIGQSLSASNFRPDVTLDRSIDASDVGFVQQRVGGNSVSLAFPQPNLLASGYDSASVVLQSDGAISSWGANPGDGTPRARSYPAPLTTLTNTISVSAGESHAAALAANSVVWAWGNNYAGQLGDGTNTLRRLPIPVFSNAIEVKAGGFHTLALLQDGTVASWGENSYGQLGVGDTANRATPVQVNGLTGIAQIAAGFQRSLALQTDGTVWTWGYQSEDPDNPGIVFYTEPVQVNNLYGIVAIAAGFGHAVAVRSSGAVQAWGNNSSGELGNGGTTYSAVPVEVKNLSNVVSVSAGLNHTLALLADGTVRAWGSNEFGQLGIGSEGDFSSRPVQVAPLTNIVAIAAARSYSMAMQADGTIWAWGQANSALGLASLTNTTTPQQVAFGLLDQNANSMDDRWELQYFGNLDQTAEGDFDGDGISNLAEFQDSHTNPVAGDSDGDFVLDGDEIAAGSDPNDNTSYPPRLRDASRYLRMTSYFDYVHIEYFLEASWGSFPGGEEDISPHPFLIELGPILGARIALPADVERSYGGALVAAFSHTDNLLLQHRRLWLHRFPATGVEARQKVLVIKNRQLDMTVDPTQARLETLIIPPGQTTSNAIDSATDFSQVQSVPTQSVPEFIEERIVPVDIYSVSFRGDKYWELEKDDGTTVYEAPHWVDMDHNSDPTNTAIGERNYPVAFTRHTKPKIGAAFKIPGLTAGTPIKIRAHGSDGIEIPATAATIDGQYTTLPLTPSTTCFVDTIKYYNKDDSTAFTLTWELSVDGEATWLEIGTTKHTVYVTLADPLTPLRYETIAHIGARNADGAESESVVVDAIWHDFEQDAEGLSVRRVGSTSAMKYWGPWAASDEAEDETPDCFSVAGLLLHGDGRCAAWMRFLDAAFRFQGIDGTATQEITTLPIKAESWEGHGFYVKYWDISEFPPTDLPGVPGQGNANPRAVFPNHGVLQYLSEVYDPSYGKKYAGPEEWEEASLDLLIYRDLNDVLHPMPNNPDHQTQMLPHL